MTKKQKAKLKREMAVAAKVEKMSAMLYDTRIVRKMIRAQLAAAVYGATQTNYASNALENRVRESFIIADTILRRA